MSSKSVLKRSKSLEFIDMEELGTALEKFHYNSTTTTRSSTKTRVSESSIEISIINDSGSDMDTSADLDPLGTGFMGLEREEEGRAEIGDSGICERAQDCDVLRRLELKVEKLGECFQEQNRLLAALKEQMTTTSQAVERAATEHSQLASEIINITLAQRLQYLQLDGAVTISAGAGAESDAAENVNSRARALLDALEVKRESSIDRIVKSALTEFLQSDLLSTPQALKDQMVSATMQSIKHLIEGCFNKDVTASYLPLLERSHRRLLRQVTKTLDDTFREMEANTASFSRSSYITTRNMNSVLKRHQRLVEDSMASNVDAQTLKNMLDSILGKELKQWREKVTEMMTELNTSSSKELVSTTSTLAHIPSSPPQPTEAGRSAIDQLMNAAEINVQMKEGNINGSFEKALSASDLSLVMAACRAADPAVVFASPCCLQQHILLSLVQQLASDMVHDTQLKCRYLEDALMHLDTENPTTRSYVPTVIRQVRHQLMTFRTKFPGHMFSLRIKMIIMATNSLLKDDEMRNPMRICLTYDS